MFLKEFGKLAGKVLVWLITFLISLLIYVLTAIFIVLISALVAYFGGGVDFSYDTIWKAIAVVVGLNMIIIPLKNQ